MNRRTCTHWTNISPGFPFCLASSLQTSGSHLRPREQSTSRAGPLGFTRKPDGANSRRPHHQGCLTLRLYAPPTLKGALQVFVFPPGDHHSYRGAPLVHHGRMDLCHDGSFVAEVGGERMRLKLGEVLSRGSGVWRRGTSLWGGDSSLHTGRINRNRGRRLRERRSEE